MEKGTIEVSSVGTLNIRLFDSFIQFVESLRTLLLNFIEIYSELVEQFTLSLVVYQLKCTFRLLMTPALKTSRKKKNKTMKGFIINFDISF